MLTNISSTPTAASAATTMVSGSTDLERVSEHARWQVNAVGLELLGGAWPVADRAQMALNLAFTDTGLFEDEDVLEDDHVTFHALDLGDVCDLARAILEPVLVDDQVDCHEICSRTAFRGSSTPANSTMVS